MNEHEIVELRQAYRVLGLAHTASVSDIKRAYRALLKRWHPDLYVSGTQNHDDATRMAKTINESYSRVKHAPLRYYIERPSTLQTTVVTDLPTPAEPGAAGDDGWPRIDRIEFWVRFVCGAVLGVFMSLNLALQFYTEESLSSFVIGSVIVTLGCGFASAHYGDRFWHEILGRWWLWS